MGSLKQLIISFIVAFFTCSLFLVGVYYNQTHQPKPKIELLASDLYNLEWTKEKHILYGQYKGLDVYSDNFEVYHEIRTEEIDSEGGPIFVWDKEPEEYIVSINIIKDYTITFCERHGYFGYEIYPISTFRKLIIRPEGVNAPLAILFY